MAELSARFQREGVASCGHLTGSNWPIPAGQPLPWTEGLYLTEHGLPFPSHATRAHQADQQREQMYFRLPASAEECQAHLNGNEKPVTDLRHTICYIFI